MPIRIFVPKNGRSPAEVLDYYNEQWNLDEEKLKRRYFSPRLMRMNRRFVKATVLELDCLQVGAHYEAIRRRFPIGQDPGRVLEVGAGCGRTLFPLSRTFPQSEFWGLEYSTAGPENAKRYERLMHEEIEAVSAKLNPHGRKPGLVNDFRTGDARQMPYENKFFDVTYTNLVLEQIPEPQNHEKALGEIRRVTKTLCCFLEPWAEAQTWVTMSYLRHVNYFRRRASVLAELGYKNVEFRALHFSGNPRFHYGFVTAELA